MLGRFNWSSELTRLDRVRQRTPAEINRRMDQATEARLALYTRLPQEAVSLRIGELEQEWDIERTLGLQAGLFGLAGLLLGRGRRGGWTWHWLAALHLLSLAQYALTGWCPLVELHRQLGVRTRREIEAEKASLKALRGDYGQAAAGAEPGAPTAALLASAARGGQRLPDLMAEG